MRLMFHMSDGGQDTGMRTLPLEPFSPPTLPDSAQWTAADGTRQPPPALAICADSTPWGAFVALIGLTPPTVERALALGLTQMAQQEETERAHAEWLASLAKPAFFEHLIRNEEWAELARLRDAGKLRPEYQQLVDEHVPPLTSRPATLPELETPATVTPAPPLAPVTASENPTVSAAEMTSTVSAITWDELAQMMTNGAVSIPAVSPESAPAAVTPSAKAAARRTRQASRTPATKKSPTSGGATANARSKRSSAASKRPSSSRASSRVKSIAG